MNKRTDYRKSKSQTERANFEFNFQNMLFNEHNKDIRTQNKTFLILVHYSNTRQREIACV